MFQTNLTIPVGDIQLKGDLTLPANAQAIIVFAHGSGSSRFSPRNKKVADYLVQQGFGTFLFDLLTPAEDQVFENRFNIKLLASRLVSTANWLTEWVEADYQLGFFGASTGAAAALVAAAAMRQVDAVVCRGGRPDLAMDRLAEVQAPTLLIVGSLDTNVLELNNKALAQLKCIKKLEVIPGASHLFEEEGTLDNVCIAAASWFKKYLLSQ